MRSIRFKFLAFISTLLVFLLVLLNTYPIMSSRDRVFEEKKSSISSQASVIASSLASLDRLEHSSIREVLELLDIRGFKRITVVDDTAEVVYDSTASGVGKPTDNRDILTALDGRTVFRSDFRNNAFTSGAAQPMTADGKTIGAVYLMEVDTERAEIILSMQSRLKVFSIVITVASLALASVFSFMLLRRMRELVQSIKIVASGDYSYRLDTTGRDEITELGNEFNLLTQRLDDTERQRRRFVSDASHELKTPLASIRLLSDSIVQNEGMDSVTVREFVTDIGNEAERLQRTTEKLLDLSRFDDDVQILPEPVDVKQVAVDALVLLRPLADERQVKLKCELEDGCVVMATVDDMFHILFNLMENAIKYNVTGGSVLLTLKGTEEKVQFTVADTGIGIPEEDRFNIFSRFYRVDKARSREAGGSGLGLSIVHDAVQAHGGTIAVGQNKPQGSLFIVTFPRPSDEETGI